MEQKDDDFLPNKDELRQQETPEFLYESVRAILNDEALFNIDLQQRGEKPYTSVEIESTKRMMNRILIRLLESNPDAYGNMFDMLDSMVALRRERYANFRDDYLSRLEFFGGEVDTYAMNQRMYLMVMAKELSTISFLSEEILPRIHEALSAKFNGDL